MRLLTDRGLVVVALDMQGHGRSAGMHGLVPSLATYARDVHAHMQQLTHKSEYADLPFFVMGHSMGALVMMDYILTYPSSRVCGYLTLGGLLQLTTQSQNIVMRAVGRTLKHFFPEYPAIAPKTDLVKTRSYTCPKAMAEERADLLTYWGGTRIQTALGLYDGLGRVRNVFNKVNIPIFGVHGLDDGVTSHKGLELLIQQSPASDKTMRLIEGARHILFREPNGVDVEIVTEVGEWLRERCHRFHAGELRVPNRTPPSSARSNKRPSELDTRDGGATTDAGGVATVAAPRVASGRSPQAQGGPSQSDKSGDADAAERLALESGLKKRAPVRQVASRSQLRATAAANIGAQVLGMVPVPSPVQVLSKETEKDV